MGRLIGVERVSDSALSASSFAKSISSTADKPVVWEKTLGFSFTAAKYRREQRCSVSGGEKRLKKHPKKTNLMFQVCSEIAVFTKLG
ncbi:hypothetical protein QQF64_015829 [Cirrhinus molitorella]|uniref:Uncharacterized protein n=1 Tax=Cirrhinus molitorella TaxID=172907 RepID=A0ABR3LMQ2_9TELE